MTRPLTPEECEYAAEAGIVGYEEMVSPEAPGGWHLIDGTLHRCPIWDGAEACAHCERLDQAAMDADAASPSATPPCRACGSPLSEAYTVCPWCDVPDPWGPVNAHERGPEGD